MAGNKSNRPEGSGALLREAATWFERIHAEEVATEDLGEWQRWLASSSANQQAFSAIEDFWRRAGELEKLPWATQFELDVDTYDSTTPVAAWRQRPAPRRRSHLWTFAAAFGGVAACVAVYVLVDRGFSGPPELAVFETASGEHRQIALPDGTNVLLGARSTISVTLTDEARNVVVDRGEVFFDVASDKSWPFVVRAGATTITAVGTAFNVQNLEGRVVITVAEGAVEVANIRARAETADAPQRMASESAPAVQPRRVKAGERLAYGAVATEVQPVDPEMALAWRKGRLQYLNEPLRFVIPDVARYTNRQLVITDPAVEELLYTGSVMQDQIDDWLTSLGDIFPIDIERIGENRVVLQGRGTTQQGE